MIIHEAHCIRLCFAERNIELERIGAGCCRPEIQLPAYEIDPRLLRNIKYTLNDAVAGRTAYQHQSSLTEAIVGSGAGITGNK